MPGCWGATWERKPLERLGGGTQGILPQRFPGPSSAPWWRKVGEALGRLQAGVGDAAETAAFFQSSVASTPAPLRKGRGCRPVSSSCWVEFRTPRWWKQGVPSGMLVSIIRLAEAGCW